jgi:hypothetical protein
MLSAVRRRCVAILFSARPRYYVTPSEAAKNDRVEQQEDDDDDNEIDEDEEEEDFYGEEFDDDGREYDDVVAEPDEYDDDKDIASLRQRPKTLAQREAALDSARARAATKRGVVLNKIRPEPPVNDESDWQFVRFLSLFFAFFFFFFFDFFFFFF